MNDTRYLRTQAKTVCQQTDGLRIDRPIDASNLLTLMRSIEIKLISYRNRVKKQEITIWNQAQQIALLEKQLIRQTGPFPRACDAGTKGSRQLKPSAEVVKFGQAEKEPKMPKIPIDSVNFRSDLDQELRRVDQSYGSCSRYSKQLIIPSPNGSAAQSNKSTEAIAVASMGGLNSDYISSLQRISVSPDTATFRFWFWPSKSAPL